MPLFLAEEVVGRREVGAQFAGDLVVPDGHRLGGFLGRQFGFGLASETIGELPNFTNWHDLSGLRRRQQQATDCGLQARLRAKDL